MLSPVSEMGWNGRHHDDPSQRVNSTRDIYDVPQCVVAGSSPIGQRWLELNKHSEDLQDMEEQGDLHHTRVTYVRYRRRSI